jgi:hypothetical protein
VTSAAPAEPLHLFRLSPRLSCESSFVRLMTEGL